MALFSITEGRFSFGRTPLLDDININIDQGERICLLGRNGAGKSTLMKLIAGELSLESGQLVRHQQLNIATLEQQVPTSTSGSIFDIVTDGLGKYGKLLADYHHTSKLLQTEQSDALLAKLDRLSKKLDADRGWHRHRLVDQVLTNMNLDGEANFANLSAGMKRRVLLAKSLVLSPDILLLDEPTNHLDIEAVTWLENFLLSYDKAIVFVTHDRAFLKKIATRIIEIDRRDVINWQCDYDTYLQRKTDVLEAESKQNAAFDKKLASEEVWIRKGIQARRTRNEGRVCRLQEMRKRRAERINVQSTANMLIQQAEQSGRMVIKAENVSFGYNGIDIVKNFSTTILRGDKIGIIGPNGCGKTTLLNLLLTELSPKQGTVTLGTKLQISYFDQLHAQLDEQKTVLENVSYGNDTITINGNPRHIVGYLQDFLFPPERSRTLVSNLSGGERNRLLLARLFTKPANVLVLDEPTNDLDIPTLELLEELLQEYSGTLLLVSHDRTFINNVVTSTLVFKNDGKITEYVGGYDETLHGPKEQEPIEEKPVDKPKKPREKSAGSRKLNFNEKRELTALPKQIEEFETEQQQLHQLMTSSDFYKQPNAEIAKATCRLEFLRQQLSDLYARWEHLEQFAK